MSGAEVQAVEFDTKLLQIQLLGIAGGRVWVLETFRNLLVAFDLETGRETFRRESAKRVSLLDEIVLIEDGGEVTAVDPASGQIRSAGHRPYSNLIGATPRHLWCGFATKVVALELASGLTLNELELTAKPIAGIASFAREVALTLEDGNVVVLAVDGATLRTARALDVQRVPRDAVLPPISTQDEGLLVPVVESTVHGPRTRLLALDHGALAARAEVDLAASTVSSNGALVALTDAERTVVLGTTGRMELPGELVALRDPYVLTRRADTYFLGVLTAETAVRVALPALPDASEAALGPHTLVWRAASRLVVLRLPSIPLVDGAAVSLSLETRSEAETAEVTFVSPRGFASVMSPRFGKLTALLDVTGWQKGDRVVLDDTSSLLVTRTVRSATRLAPGADSSVVTRRSFSVADAPFAKAREEAGLAPDRVLAALDTHLTKQGASIPPALDRLVRAHHAPHFADRLSSAVGILLVEPHEREGRVVFATTSAGHVSFELILHEGMLAVVGWSRRTETALFEATSVEAFLAERLARRKEALASSVATVASEIGVNAEAPNAATRWAPSSLLDRILPMHRAPDHAALEARLGLRMGPTLRALVEMAYRVYPDSPSDAFAHLPLYLHWIDPEGPTADSIRFGPMTPREIRPFAETRGDLTHMGFLLDDTDHPADARPVVFVEKDWPPAHVIARDLASFLGLIARGGAEGIMRDREPDGVIYVEEPASWFRDGARRATPETAGWRAPSGYDAARFLEMIPGVARPARSRDVTQALPDRTFTYEK